MNSTQFCGGLCELIDSYDGYIIDPWGVLHDGQAPYEGALDALEKLVATKKQIVILSNSGRRAEANLKRLEGLGFPGKLFKHIVTPGEMCWQGLKKQEESIFKGIGDSCILLTRGKDKEIVEGLDLDLVDEAEDADFILITNTDAPEKSLADYEPVLRKAAARRIPAICADPDLECLIGNESVMGPGEIARRFQQFGGVVHYIGKPYPAIYRYAMSLFEDILPARVLVVGDSLSHDIAGGAALDIDTALVSRGIHAGALYRKGAKPAEFLKRLDKLVLNYGIRPKWLMETFRYDNPHAEPAEEGKRRKKRGRMAG